jgi:tetratricopeptide (TPR) repeat protein
MVNLSLLEKYEGKIEDIFPKEEKYSFLGGAGISMDAPTNMPSAPQIVKTLLEFCVPSEELEKVLSLKMLRYELVVEIIQAYDEDLRFLDYLELFEEPNLIHLFLANMICKGHYVVTTNFDYLVEYALKKVLPKKLDFNIYPIITKEDFLALQNPETLIKSGKYPLFKIHGTKRNIITGTDTRNSLITTITALGKEREEGKTFAIEPFKKPAMYNMMKGRILVIFGYSGSDDFDIGPMLKELPFLKRIIWIEHSMTDQIEIYKINKINNSDLSKDLSHQEQLLAEIRKISDFEVYLIKANTRKFIKDKLWKFTLPKISIPKLKKNKRRVEIPKFQEWVKPIFENISLIFKYKIACSVYEFLKNYTLLEPCCEKAIKISEENQDESSKTHFLNYLAYINQIKGNYDEALKKYEEALSIDEKLGDKSGQGAILHNIGNIYLNVGKFREAFEKFYASVQIAEELGNEFSKISSYTNIAKLYEMGHQFDLAFKFHDDSLKIAEKVGDLTSKATILNNLGYHYNIQNNFDLALEKYYESLKIAEQLGDLYGKFIVLNNIGRIFQETQQVEKALEKFNEAIFLTEQLGDLSKKAGIISNIGSIFSMQKNFDMALKHYTEALNIEKKIGDPLLIATYINNIGYLYQNKGENELALKQYQEGFNVIKNIGHSEMKAIFLNKIGTIYFLKKNYKAALESFQQCVLLYEQLKDYANQAAVLNNIGKIYEYQEKYNEALKCYKDAFEIDDNINDEFGKASDLFNIGKIYEIKEEFESALTNFEKSFQIFNQLENSQYAGAVQQVIEKLKNKMN